MAAKSLTRRQAPAGPRIDEAKTRVYYWWLLLAIFFEYVRPGTFIPAINAIKLGTVIPGVLLAVTLFAPGMRPWAEIFSDRYAKWLVAYIGVIAFSLPFAVVTVYAYDTLTTVLTHFTLFLMIARIATSFARLRGVFATLIAAHVVLVILNPALVLTPEVRSYIKGSPFLGDGNDFALSCCILMPLAIEIARNSRSKLRIALAWSAVVIIILAILGTQSRGASLAMATVFAFLWVYSKKKTLSFIAILLFGSFVLIYASDAYFERMETITHYQEDGSAEARLVAWTASVKMAIDHPLLGVGAGHFPTAYGRYKVGGPPRMTAHSIYFLVLGELGLPGVVTLMALVFGSPMALLSLRRRVIATIHGPPMNWQLEAERFLCMLAAGCVGFAAAGAFLSVAYYPHLFVLTAATSSARLIVKDRLDQPHNEASQTGPAMSRYRGQRNASPAQQPHAPSKPW